MHLRHDALPAPQLERRLAHGRAVVFALALFVVVLGRYDLEGEAAVHPFRRAFVGHVAGKSPAEPLGGEVLEADAGPVGTGKADEEKDGLRVAFGGLGNDEFGISHETEMEGGDDMAEVGGERRGFLASGADGMEMEAKEKKARDKMDKVSKLVSGWKEAEAAKAASPKKKKAKGDAPPGGVDDEAGIFDADVPANDASALFDDSDDDDSDAEEEAGGGAKDAEAPAAEGEPGTQKDLFGHSSSEEEMEDETKKRPNESNDEEQAAKKRKVDEEED